MAWMKVKEGTLINLNRTWAVFMDGNIIRFESGAKEHSVTVEKDKDLNSAGFEVIKRSLNRMR